jgi:hypothetical protein
LVPPPPKEEEEEEEEEVVEAPVLPVELYKPPDLSEEEEALRWAIEESELIELGNWEVLRAQLAALASSSGAGTSSSRAAPPLPPPTAEPQPWGCAVCESPPACLPFS